MRSQLPIIILFLLLLGLPTPQLQAEFLRTGPLTYQGTDKKSKIIISQQKSGIYITYGKESDLQTFDPGTLTKEDTLHIFISFDPTLNRYNQLIHGSRKFTINGNLILILGKLRITIDNNNPYLSIVSEQDAGLSNTQRLSPSVLGFHGLKEVVNADGQEALALFEANQFQEYRQLIVPYVVGSTDIELRGKKFTGNMVGVDLVVKNHCLSKNAVLINKTDLAAASAAPTVEEKRKLLKKLVDDSRKKNPLNSHLKLRVTKEEIIALDYKTGELKIVREMQNSTDNQKICVMEARVMAH